MSFNLSNYWSVLATLVLPSTLAIKVDEKWSYTICVTNFKSILNRQLKLRCIYIYIYTCYYIYTILTYIYMWCVYYLDLLNSNEKIK